jgi:DNA sulfur modification protein DndB
MKKIDFSSNFVFSALRGIQGGREYYVAMCPLKVIPKIFLFNEAELPAKLRSQRKLNKSRIPEMTKYITNNKSSYFFSSLTASVDGDVTFISTNKDGHLSRVGTLIVPMDSRFIINDGQHRRAAIERAITENSELGSETISVVFYVDRGLKNCQQIFSDLNRHAVKPTKSLNILYDNRDPFSKELIELINKIPIFSDDLTEFEKTSISNRQNKVFTLNSIYHATRELTKKKGKDNSIEKLEKEFIMEFWSEVHRNMADWKDIVNGSCTPYDMRLTNISVYGITLHALGLVGKTLQIQKTTNWKNSLKKLNKIDWSRKNKDWNNRALIGGKLTKMNNNVILTSNYIKIKLGLKLNERENELEKSVMYNV